MQKVKLSFICILLIANNCIEAKDFDIDQHKKTNNKCHSCHQQSELNSIITADSDLDQCQKCHNLGEMELRKVSSKEGDSKSVTENSTKSKENKNVSARLASGMRYPMYYQGSRLSDKPNEMILIPAGEFIMGTDDRLPDEGPQHKINLPAYYIDVCEVTNLQYKKFNNATNR